MVQGTLFEVKKKPPVLSYSKLDQFVQCPFRYEKDYIQKISSKKLKGGYQFGLSLHQALAKYLDPKKEKIQFKRNDFGKALKSAWFSESYDNEEDSERAHERAVDMIDSLSQKTQYFNTIPKLVETRFRVPLEAAVLIGSIDRIDQEGSSIEIIDYKSGDKNKGADGLKQDLQWFFYYHGCKKILGKYPDKMTYIFFDTGRVASFLISRDDVKKATERFEKAFKALLAEKEFKPTQNQWCFNCRFDKECVENKKFSN